MTDGGAVDERLLPHRHDGCGGFVRPGGLAGGVGAFDQCGDLVDGLAQFELDKPCVGFAAVGQRQACAQRQVAGNGVYGLDWVRQFEFVEEGVQVESGLVRMFEQPQQHACGAEFQCLRYLHAIGVADDDVQTAVCIGGVGFVARIDDRAFEGGLQADFGVDVVGALAELVARDLAVLANPYAAGAGVDLAGDEVEGHQARD